jgi:Cys-rich repeat protein
MTNADCAAPLVRCDTTASPNRCVECLADGDCAGDLVCDVPARACVECTADEHCGGATSGRVCDAESSACQAGCRGQGGNGCPAGQICSSDGPEAGTCAAPPPPDAGIPDAGMVEEEDVGGCGGCAAGGRGDAGALLAVFLVLGFVASTRRARRSLPPTA